MSDQEPRYTVVSADTHAGGIHAMYREFLESKYHEAFDAWRGTYKNPFSDLGDARRYRNWDDDMRNSQQDEDGVVGEVIFPNTVPPFFPSLSCSPGRRSRTNTSSAWPVSGRITAGWRRSVSGTRSGGPASARSS